MKRRTQEANRRCDVSGEGTTARVQILTIIVGLSKLIAAVVVIGCISGGSPEADVKVAAPSRQNVEAVASCPRRHPDPDATLDAGRPRGLEPAARDGITTAPPLVRSEAVIADKLARKEAKLARPAGRGRDAGPASGPDEVMRQRRLARLDGDGEIKPNDLMDAKAHSDAMPLVPVDDDPTSDGGIWSWEWLGPGNIGGRVRTVCFRSDSTFFVGSAGGGIWRTTNAGASWSPINDFLPSLAVTSIVLDPTNIDRMYAATGEGFGNGDALPGAGVFRSTDGGNSWAQLPATAGWQFTNRLAHHPTIANLVFAAEATGIWRTSDGGNNWTQVLTGNFLDVKIDPVNVTRPASACSRSPAPHSPRTWAQRSTFRGAPSMAEAAEAVAPASPSRAPSVNPTPAP